MWLRGLLRELAVTDEREIAMIRRFGYPEARPLAEIDPLADVTGHDDEGRLRDRPDGQEG